MDVTPQLLHDVEFREAKRGGYNTQDVDDFLERLAVALERQDVQMREARQRVEAAESRVAEAERRAAQAEQRAAETSDSDETLKRTLVLAQRTADAAIREAEEQAARTLGSAQEQASRLLAEAQDASARAQAQAQEDARSAHEEARALVLAEMGELEGVRDQLRYDVDLLERHLDGQRSRLRDVVQQLQALLDDPGSLGAVAAPEVSDVTTPAGAAAGWQQGDAGWAPASTDDAPYEAPAPETAHQGYDDDQAYGEQPAYEQPAYEQPAYEQPAYEQPADVEAEPQGHGDDGPPTQPVEALAERDADDDAYLAELRKAMTDESPLGPRDEGGDDLFDSGADPGRSRFGRRR